MMSNTPSDQRNNRKKSGGNWIGIIIFLIIFGSQFIPQILNSVQQVIGQGTAQQLAGSISSLAPILITGAIVLLALWSVVSGITRGMGSLNTPSRMPTSTGGNSAYIDASNIDTTTLPLSPFPQSKVPTSWNTSSPFPPGVHLGDTNLDRALTYSSQIPRGVNMEIPRSVNMEQISRSATPSRYHTPGFEPLVNGAVLMYGILVVLLVGGGLMFLGWMNGLLP
jgi:hypothetical protein